MNLNIFLKYYSNEIVKELNNININIFQNIIKTVEKKIKKKKTIFICGNGGSSAIASHYICDYLKLIRTNTELKPRIISLNDNIETITAIGNDINFNQIFKFQAESLCGKDDLIIIISSSGNSENILELARWCKNNKITTINFVGFGGGKLSKLSKLSLVLQLKNYGQTEDIHHMLMHIMMHYIIKKNSKKKSLRL
jgi:phosphoheptose isomerase